MERPVEEDSVDRKAHEEHVDRRRRTDEQALADAKARTPEQSLHPAESVVRNLAALADEAAAVLALDAH
jgi:hypothetical protein